VGGGTDQLAGPGSALLASADRQPGPPLRFVVQLRRVVIIFAAAALSATRKQTWCGVHVSGVAWRPLTLQSWALARGIPLENACP